MYQLKTLSFSLPFGRIEFGFQSVFCGLFSGVLQFVTFCPCSTELSMSFRCILLLGALISPRGFHHIRCGQAWSILFINWRWLAFWWRSLAHGRAVAFATIVWGQIVSTAWSGSWASRWPRVLGMALAPAFSTTGSQSGANLCCQTRLRRWLGCPS